MAVEGALTVRGFQYANPSDASLARRQEAENRVREAGRRARLALPCAWCGNAVSRHVEDGRPVELGGPLLHRECACEFDAFTNRHQYTDELSAC